MTVHVAVAVIENSAGQILIAKRKPDSHMGGKWEFPGGKLESGETVQQALRREILEELDVVVDTITPLIKVRYEYPGKTVLLDVWRLENYAGIAKGNEGQDLRWCNPCELVYSDFPPANIPIINALKLPEYYFITPDLKPGNDEEYLQAIKCSIEKGVSLLQLRCPQYGDDVYLGLAEQVHQLCAIKKTRLILNRDPSLLSVIAADGVHLSTARLFAYNKRPIAADKWLSASCHNEVEVRQAKQLNVDYISLSPIKQTLSHPAVNVLGWKGFEALSLLAGVPVYALGGMSQDDVQQAKCHGGRGIAGIRTFLMA